MSDPWNVCSNCDHTKGSHSAEDDGCVLCSCPEFEWNLIDVEIPRVEEQLSLDTQQISVQY
jgi:hypothetical protein